MVTKKSIIPNQKFISNLLLIIISLGGVAALMATALPILGLNALNYTLNGRPAPNNFVTSITQLVFITFPVAKIMLLLGSISAILYTFLDGQNKIFLRVWGVALFLLFIAALYGY